MITRVEGDLLAADVDAVVNTVNCVGVMGKGIALQVKRRYPEVFSAYQRACKRGEVEIGRMLVVESGQATKPRFVINFPTKKHWRSPSQLGYIEQGLVALKEAIREHGIHSIAIPPLGAGNGGLRWADVEPLIVRALGGLDDVDIRLYVPSAEPRAVVGKPNVRMTWGRAVLVALLGEYVTQRLAVEPWEDDRGASHLEIQKLMYFANEIEPRLGLDFQPARYGPYSEKVRHLIQEMEGTFLEGHGDGSAAVLALEPIAPTDLAQQELAKFQIDDRTPVPRIAARVLDLVEGFEGAYGLELLASTHWVLRYRGDSANAAAQVRGWTQRKGRIFTDDHVNAAVAHLQGVAQREAV